MKYLYTPCTDPKLRAVILELANCHRIKTAPTQRRDFTAAADTIDNAKLYSLAALGVDDDGTPRMFSFATSQSEVWRDGRSLNLEEFILAITFVAPEIQWPVRIHLETNSKYYFKIFSDASCGFDIGPAFACVTLKELESMVAKHQELFPPKN